MGDEEAGAVETGEVVESPQKPSSHKSSRSSRSSRSSKSKSGSSRSSKRSSKSSSKSSSSSSKKSSRSHRSSKSSSSKSRHKSSSGSGSSSKSRSSKDKDVVVLEDDDDNAASGRTANDAIPLEDDADDGVVSGIRAKLKKKSSSSSSSKSKSRSSRSSRHSHSSRSSRHNGETNGASAMDIDVADSQQPPELSAKEAEKARKFAEKMAALEAKAAEKAAAQEAAGGDEVKAPIKMQVTTSGNTTSASVDETNRVRMAMGLPPLSTGPSKEDLARQREEARQLEIKNEQLLEAARQRVEALRRERQHKKAVAGLSIAEMLAGDASSSDALSWVTKQREQKSSREMKREGRRVKALEEMFADEEDDDFGPIVPDNNGGVSADGGVRIAHNASDFKMGEETILVLEDQRILNEKGDFNEGDALQSIGISEKEKLERNKRRKAGRREYDPYADGNSILSHYDEEDPKKRGLRIGDDGISIGGAGSNNGVVPQADDMSEEAIRMRLESQTALNINKELTLQSETFTTEEWAALGMNRKKKKKKKKDKKSKKKSKKRQKIPHTAPPDFASWPIELQEEWLEDEKKRLATSLVDELNGSAFGDSSSSSSRKGKKRGGHLKEESERMERENAEREARYSKTFALAHSKNERLKDDYFDKKKLLKDEDADGDVNMEERDVDPLISLKASEEASRRQAALTRQAERAMLTSAFADSDDEDDDDLAANLERQRRNLIMKEEEESLSAKVRKTKDDNKANLAPGKVVVTAGADFVAGLGNDKEEEKEQYDAAVAPLETGEDAPVVEDIHGLRPINQEEDDGSDEDVDMEDDEDEEMEDARMAGESGTGWVTQNADGSMVPIQKKKKKKKVPKKAKVEDDADDDDNRTGDFLEREPLASGGMSDILKLVKRRGLLKDEREFTGRANDSRPNALADDSASNISLLRRDARTGKILTPQEAFRQLSHKFHGREPSKSKQEKSMKEEEIAQRRKLRSRQTNSDTSALHKLREAQRQAGQAHIVLDGNKPAATLLGGGHFSDSVAGHATVQIEKQVKRKGNFGGSQGGGKRSKK